MKLESSLPISQLNLLPKLIQDYITGMDEAKDFYNYPPTIESIPKSIADKQKENTDRVLLQQVIQRQYAGIERTAISTKNLDLLKDTNTFCVVTAHQLNLFAGPLYYIVKIVCTISTCNLLNSKFPDFHFVPIYWMGSEDHDFEEINHIHLYSKKIEWTDKQGGATGEYSTKTIEPLIEELKNVLAQSPYTDELISLFKDAYTQENLTKATRFLVNALFGKYGLLCVDGNDADLKRAMLPVFKDELNKQSAFRLTSQQLEKLADKNYKQQAYPREINLFYLQKNSRERIVFNEETERYTIHNTTLTFTKDAVLEELEKHPERFSPNVILRPLFQQKVLPSIAYIGGAGELSYWLQLKTVFDYHQVNFPQLILRNSIALFSSNDNEKWQNAGFQLSDLFLNIDVLKMNFLQNHAEQLVTLESYKNEIQALFAKIEKEVVSLDASLKNTVGAELQKSIQGLDTIEKKMLKSLKQKNEIELNRMEKIKNKIFPEGTLQERYENFSMYYAKFGMQSIDELVNSTNVYENSLHFYTF